MDCVVHGIAKSRTRLSDSLSLLLFLSHILKKIFFPCNENFFRAYSLFFKNFDLFSAVLGLHCCTWAFLVVVGEGYSSFQCKGAVAVVYWLSCWWHVESSRTRN